MVESGGRFRLAVNRVRNASSFDSSGAGSERRARSSDVFYHGGGARRLPGTGVGQQAKVFAFGRLGSRPSEPSNTTEILHVPPFGRPNEAV